MKIPEQEIEAGLEIPFWNMCQATDNITKDVVVNHRQRPARGNFSYVANRSLFVKWQSLYDNFEQSRKDAWTSYWITLPFGGHFGANGYPGSGYSAFIYVNAPHYQLGQDLLLDPPSTWISLSFADFSAGLSPWYFFDGEGGSWDSSEGGRVHVLATMLFNFEIDLSIRIFNRARIEFDLVGTTPINFGFNIQSYDENYGVNIQMGVLTTGHYFFDFDYRSIIEWTYFYAHSGDFYLDNIRLSKGADLPVLPLWNTEILINGDLNGNANGWELLGFVYSNNSLVANNVQDENYALISLNLTQEFQDDNYQLKFHIANGNGNLYVELINFENEDYIFNEVYSIVNGDVEEVFLFEKRHYQPLQDYVIYFWTEAQHIEISNVSFKRVGA